MNATRIRRWLADPALTPLWLLLLAWIVFSVVSPQFRRPITFVQIIEYASPTAILAVGMTFALLTAGIDLSVGAVMLVTSAAGGKLLVAGGSPLSAIAVMFAVGASWGLVNGLCVARFRMPAFVVTLATMFMARGAGLWITETRPLSLPAGFQSFTTGKALGFPIAVWLLFGSGLATHLLLTQTLFGRRIYAVGFSKESARRAGLPVGPVEFSVYVICALFATLAGLITLSQLNIVSPTMGSGRELEAIAAAVLGGVSLFGGRGSVIGACLGAILLQSVFTGLNILDADPQLSIDINEYYYPLITAAIVFAAVLLDSLRRNREERSQRPMIRPV